MIATMISAIRPVLSEGRWRRRLFIAAHRGRLMRLVEAGTLLLAVGVGLLTYDFVFGSNAPQRPLTPLQTALLLVANLVPLMALMVLAARRVARGRAAQTPGAGRGRLHVRLVALFSVIASVPTLLVVIFASLLFQYGVEFWFSDNAKVILVNADRVAQAYVRENKQRISGDASAMATDIARFLNEDGPIQDPRFAPGFAQQLLIRNLDEAAIVAVGRDGELRMLAGSFIRARPLSDRMALGVLPQLEVGKPLAYTNSSGRIEATTLLAFGRNIYLYVSRNVDRDVLQQAARSTSALSDYAALLDRARILQLRFNAALMLVSLLIVCAAIIIAFKVADRLVRPMAQLADAARLVTAGDLSARVEAPKVRDEVGALASAFNRMTRKLQEQTNALVDANSQLDSRRALTEAVLSGVTAGVISVDANRRIRLMNSSAEDLLRVAGNPVGQALSAVAPELEGLLDGREREATIQMASGGEPLTLAVKTVATEDGFVLTFDDITQQVNDQRSAAWADVARRIAHEIKNPLTPIQLAAERLQRRYGGEVTNDPTTFERLTGTIVRQVGDLRRMVDEFSSFARMPKPVFREEQLSEIARQVLFLHEVAHPSIRFVLDVPEPAPVMVCDRRQLGQAFTNIVKNAVEAIEEKDGNTARAGQVRLAISEEGGRASVTVEDDGVGLPASRERLTEPYVTTRKRGTGLGLAIVKKIVEEHFGTMSFADRPGGGSIVRMTFDAAALAPLAMPEDDDNDAERTARLPELTRTRTG
jgi:two-component system nitrogen regulation sensor histidine kinase NtrY